MSNIIRKEELINLAQKLDITPTMFKNATDKYTAIASYLQGVGLDCDIYPQGSFSLGTVVRPYRNSEDQNYDLDFICKIKETKDSTSPKEIKLKVRDLLLENKTYEKILHKEEYDKCWTLEYADIGDVSFNIDIVPAVPEDILAIIKLQQSGVDSLKASKAVALTNKKGFHYDWYCSNPQGYKDWFDEINEPFLQYNKSQRLQKILQENRGLFNYIEDIPHELDRSSLQRVIQLLKRHRDVYFSKLNNGDSLKPISAIITTLCAEIAKTAPYNLDVYDLLQFIVKEFEIYSKNQIMNEAEFKSYYSNKTTIEKKQGKWQIINPVNPNDNLADGWNNNPNLAKAFFSWINQVKTDFLSSMFTEDRSFIAALENGLGYTFVNNNINKSKYTLIEPSVITSTHKPWGDKLND